MTEPSGFALDGTAVQGESTGDSPTSGVKAGQAVKGRPRRRGWRAAFFALAAVGVIGAAAWVLFSSPLLVEIGRAHV